MGSPKLQTNAHEYGSSVVVVDAAGIPLDGPEGIPDLVYITGGTVAMTVCYIKEGK